MILPWPACVWLRSDRINGHLIHEPFDTLPVDPVSPVPQLITNAARPHKRMLHVQFINEPLKMELFWIWGFSGSLVVHRRSVYIQQAALGHDR